MEVGRKQLVSPIFYNKSAFLKEQRMNESESETMEKTENSSSTTELALPSLFQWRAFLYYELERIAIRQVFSCMQKLAAGIKYNEEELPWKLLLAEYRLLQNSLLVGTPESKCLTEIYDDVSWTEAIHKHKMSTPKFKKESMLIKELSFSEKLEIERLTKPSKTIKLGSEYDFPNVVSIKASVIPCVTDIETSKVTTKGYIIIQLLGKTLELFKRNLLSIKLHVSGSVREFSASSKEVERISPDFYKNEHTITYNLHNKRGQLKAMFDLVSQAELLKFDKCSAVKVKFDLHFTND